MLLHGRRAIWDLHSSTDATPVSGARAGTVPGRSIVAARGPRPPSVRTSPNRPTPVPFSPNSVQFSQFSSLTSRSSRKPPRTLCRCVYVSDRCNTRSPTVRWHSPAHNSITHHHSSHFLYLQVQSGHLGSPQQQQPPTSLPSQFRELLS